MAAQSGTVQAGVAEHRRQRLRSIAIVPARNEEAPLGPLLAEIRAAEPDLGIVVINDGSTDATVQVVTAAGVPLVNPSLQRRDRRTVQTGYQYALEHGYEIAIQVDGDGQHDPGEIGRVLEPIARTAPTSSSGLAS
jgi:glycosyltransferase involved in cell wall biosynthesis